MNRTHHNGQLRIENVGEIVELKGWVAKKRNLGALVFIDLKIVMELHKSFVTKQWNQSLLKSKMNMLFM